ncbi:MAG TPA: LysR family transcriptional regulator [Pirellulales bacterium]
MNIDDLKLKEIRLLLDVAQIRSVREVARQQKTQPGQISKIIAGIEHKLGLRLFERSATGVRPTATAMALIPLFEEMQRFEQRLSETLVPENRKEMLTFASTTFFTNRFLPEVLARAAQPSNPVNFRLLDLAPTQFVPVALRGGFQICLHMKPLDWPQTWTSTQIGVLRWHVYARTDHPLPRRVSLSEILKYPFIQPIYWADDGIRYGADPFPKPISERIRGYETSTADAAAELLRRTDQLACLPEVLVRPLVRSGALRAIEWKKTVLSEEPVYLAVKSGSIKQSQFTRLREVCSTLIG